MWPTAMQPRRRTTEVRPSTTVEPSLLPDPSDFMSLSFPIEAQDKHIRAEGMSE